MDVYILPIIPMYQMPSRDEQLIFRQIGPFFCKTDLQEGPWGIEGEGKIRDMQIGKVIALSDALSDHWDKSDAPCDYNDASY